MKNQLVLKKKIKEIADVKTFGRLIWHGMSHFTLIFV